MWRWLAGHQFVAALILIGGFTAAALWRDQYLAGRDRAFVSCMAGWADATAARGRALGLARAAVDTANDDLWRTFDRLLKAPGPDPRAEFDRYLKLYIVASDAYRVGLRDNPAPDPPRIRC